MEALIVLEVASQTKVSNFDFWSFVQTTQEDVFVLNVAVNDLFHVNVFQPNCHLEENLLCLLLWQIFKAKCFRVIRQVASRFILGDYMDFTVSLEEVKYSKNVVALLTDILGFGL